MIDNTRLRKAIFDFLKKNPWAKDYEGSLSLRADNVEIPELREEMSPCDSRSEEVKEDVPMLPELLKKRSNFL